MGKIVFDDGGALTGHAYPWQKVRSIEELHAFIDTNFIGDLHVHGDNGLKFCPGEEGHCYFGYDNVEDHEQWLRLQMLHTFFCQPTYSDEAKAIFDRVVTGNRSKFTSSSEYCKIVIVDDHEATVFKLTCGENVNEHRGPARPVTVEKI